jgi:hypothetical protein
MNKAKVLSRARIAFNLVDEAIAKAQVAIDTLKQTKVRDATVMLNIGSHWRERYKCATCGYECGQDSSRWKFCPSCGCEIMRWDKRAAAEQQPDTVVCVEMVPYNEKQENSGRRS